MKDSYRNIITIFKEDFSEVLIEYKFFELEKGKAHCIFLIIPSEDYLSNNWQRITNSIALNYQNHLETNFEKWNIYLFFLLPNNIEDLNLKYTIENNTFSSRKIVENASLSIEDLINKHIKNALTLEDNKDTAEVSDFIYNPIIYEVLEDKTIKKKNILPEEQKQAYKELITKLREKEE